MHQPDIGQKVAELRHQKNLTQEQLAELCEVNTRTIQRIENGESEPRAYTRGCLSKILEFDFGQQDTQNEELWLAVLHLSNMLPLVVIPLGLWSWKKNQSYQIDRQGRQVINFQVTMVLVLVGMTCLVVVFLPGLVLLKAKLGGGNLLVMSGLASLSALPLMATGVFVFYQAVTNTLRALTDRRVHYPLSIPFVK